MAYRSVCIWIAALGLAFFSGCSAMYREAHEERDLGGFYVAVDASPPRVRIGSGGREVADIDGASIAFRTASATYKEVYGSFQIEETAPPWTATSRFGAIDANQDALTIALESGGAH